jgi:type I restriction enzyme S subunit
VRFLWYQLNDESSWHRSGTGQPFIKPSDVKSRLAYLPPLSEQKRIAAILDAADALRAKRRESIEQLDSLVQATFLEMFGDPVTNPKGWPTRNLGTLGEWRTGGTPSRNHPSYFRGNVPWFSSGELNSMYVGANSKEKITESAVRESAAKWIAVGSLMLGMYDTAALKASITTAQCTCNQAVAFSSLHENLESHLYVYSAITIGREHFRRLQRGVRQKNLNLVMIRAITIPTPPLNIQTRFAFIVESIEQQKARLKAHLAELDTLFASLQSRAFNGELVA